MVSATEKSDKKGLKISAGLIITGLLLIGAAFLPFINLPQCPGEATTLANGSRCVIGVNMGAATIWMLGIAVAFVGVFCLLGLLVVKFLRRYGNKKII